MKATKEFLKSVPSDAVIYYSNRVDPSQNFAATVADQDEGFLDQFIGLDVTEAVDDGAYDGMDIEPSWKTCYCITLDEGEFSDEIGTCAAERMQIMWSV